MSASDLLVSGSNALNTAYIPYRTGTATLLAGTVAVALPALDGNDNVLLTRISAPLANGLAVSLTGGTGFTITSSDLTDTGTIQWTWIKA